MSLRSWSTKMAQSKPILYTYFRSSASWRVRIVLAFKQVDYEYKAINLLKKEQKSEDYLKICPMGQVPAFQYNGQIFTQSMAIMELLEDLFPDKPMIPKDVVLRAKMREICDIINSGIQPLHNLSVIMKHSDDAEKRTEWAGYFVHKGLKVLDTILSETSGRYCIGDEVTLADACLVPQAASASRFNVQLDEFPTVKRIYESLGELEAFKKAHAFCQPDTPPELRK